MSNLVIQLPIFIYTGIINKHCSMPFSFKIIKVVIISYSILIILSRLQTYQIVFLKPYLLIENSYIYWK